MLAIVDVDEDVTKRISIRDISNSIGSDVYDVGIFVPNSIPPDRLIARHIFVREVSFPQNFIGSAVRAGTPPELQAILQIRLNGQQMGTITFGPNQSNGTIVSPVLLCPSGSTLDIWGPVYLDMKFSDLAITLRGVRQ
jgi:hypothetical protein